MAEGLGRRALPVRSSRMNSNATGSATGRFLPPEAVRYLPTVGCRTGAGSGIRSGIRQRPLRRRAHPDVRTIFRYERRLLSAEDMHAWLAMWHVTQEEWLDHVRRSLLRHRYVADLDSITARYAWTIRR